MADYLDILKQWKRDIADPVIFEHIDELFPAFGFVLVQECWCSPLKMDLSRPQTPRRDKTVVSRADMRFREQGRWNDSVSVNDMLMSEYRLSSIYEVCRMVSDRFCIPMPSTSAYDGSRDRRQRVLAKLQDYFTWNIENNSGYACKAARRYLTETRGFTDEWIRRLGIGFVPAWDKVVAAVASPRNRITPEELDEACKVTSQDGYTSVGRDHVIAIPYRCGGELKGFLFRSVDPEVRPKYRANTSLERKSVFFNMPEDREPKDIIVVEGELDALTATAAGIANVVSIGGSEISKDRESQVFDALNRNTRRITLCLDLDTDKEGRPNEEKWFACVKRSIHSIQDAKLDFDEIYIARFPTPSDPDEFIRSNGAEAFTELIRNAKPWHRVLSEHYSR